MTSARRQRFSSEERVQNPPKSETVSNQGSRSHKESAKSSQKRNSIEPGVDEFAGTSHSSQSLTVLSVLFDLGSWDVPHDPVLNAQSGRMFRRRKHFLNACRFDCPFCIDEDD
jgi:hypothetical protein